MLPVGNLETVKNWQTDSIGKKEKKVENAKRRI
jgi:hypothetical protein